MEGWPSNHPERYIYICWGSWSYYRRCNSNLELITVQSCITMQ